MMFYAWDARSRHTSNSQCFGGTRRARHACSCFCSAGSDYRFNYVPNCVGMFGGNLKQNARRAFGQSASLFPVLQCRHTDSEQRGKLPLREPIVCANLSHVGFFCDVRRFVLLFSLANCYTFCRRKFSMSVSIPPKSCDCFSRDDVTRKRNQQSLTISPHDLPYCC